MGYLFLGMTVLYLICPPVCPIEVDKLFSLSSLEFHHFDLAKGTRFSPSFSANGRGDRSCSHKMHPPK